MAGFAPRKESAFARRLLSGIDSLIRNNDPSHLSALSKRFEKGNDETFDSSSSLESPQYPPRRRRKPSTASISKNPVVPNIQRRPMRFFPTTTPAVKREDIRSVTKRNRKTLAVADDESSNDAQEFVQKPQHGDNYSPRSTTMYNKSDMDAYSDFAGAPTEIATNRAITLTMSSDLIQQRAGYVVASHRQSHAHPSQIIASQPNIRHDMAKQDWEPKQMYEPTNSSQQPIRIPAMKAIFRPRHEGEPVPNKATWHKERKRGALLIPELQSCSSIELRNQPSADTPDPIFCSNPESPSTRGGSFGSDYVSTADYSAMRISPHRREDEGHRLQDEDHSAVTLNRNGSDDAVLPGPYAPDSAVRPRDLTGVWVPVVPSNVQARWRPAWPPNRTDVPYQSPLATFTKREEEKRKQGVYRDSGTVSTRKEETLSSYLNGGTRNAPTGVQRIRSKFEHLSKPNLQSEFDSDDDDDGGSVKSLTEYFERVQGNDALDDDGDDDDGSVRSLKERFEKPQRPIEVKSDVRKLAAMFESKKSHVNKRFECENAAVKKAYSKFEDLHKKSKRAHGRSPDKLSMENQPRAAKAVEDGNLCMAASTVVEICPVESEGSNAPHVSVADRIKALSAANSAGAFKNRFPIKRAGAVNSQNAIEKSQITDERAHKAVASIESTNGSIFQNRYPHSRNNSLMPLDAITKTQTEPHLDIPDIIQPSQLFISRTSSAPTSSETVRVYSQPLRAWKASPVSIATTLPAKAVYSSNQPEHAEVPSDPPVFAGHETGEDDPFDIGPSPLEDPVNETSTVRCGAWGTDPLGTGLNKRAVVEPGKHTKYIPSEAGRVYSHAQDTCVSPAFATPPLPTKAASLSSQSDCPEVPVVSPEIGEGEASRSNSQSLVEPMKETAAAKRVTGSTILGSTAMNKRTVADPGKYTKSIASDPLLIARRLVKNNMSSVKQNPVKRRTDNSNSGSEEVSDAVTLDASLTEVSSLTAPMSAIHAVPGKSITAGKCEPAKKPEPVFGRPSEMRTPLRNNVLRTKQIMSDEESADSPFDWHTSTQQVHNQDRITEAFTTQNSFEPPNVTRSSATSFDDVFPTFEDDITAWNDSGWDLQQISTSFPDTNTSSTDIFEFDSEWQSSPTRGNHNHGQTNINPMEDTMVHYSSTQSSPEYRVTGIARILNTPDQDTGRGHLSHREEASPPDANASSVSSATNRDPEIRKKHLPTWKRRLGVSSLVSESPKSITLSSHAAKPVSGLPPRSNPSTTQYANLMSRLEKLKQTRKMRATRPASSTRHSTTILSCAAEVDDFSSSSYSSTRFGGSTFMEALEVD